MLNLIVMHFSYYISLHNRRYWEFAKQRVRHASLARFAANSQQHLLCVLIQFFNIFFVLSLDKKFRSKLCYFLFTDINGLPECLKYATARMFAGDTTITNSRKSTARFHREVNHDLNNLQNWPLANQLSLNVLKRSTCILPLIITYLILESLQ